MSTNIKKISESLTESIVALGNVREVEKELLEFVREYDKNEQLRQTLSDETLPFENRVAIVREIVEGALPATKAVLTFVVAAELSAEVDEIVRDIIDSTAAHRGANVAFVTSAKELTSEQVETIQKALEESTGRNIEIQVNVDESLLGGLSVALGETIIDGSLISRLNQIR